MAEKVNCPICGEEIGMAPVVCDNCHTPHHWDCWEYNGGCAIYSCPRKVKKRQHEIALPDKLTSVVPVGDLIHLPAINVRKWDDHVPANPIWNVLYIAWLFVFILSLQAELTIVWLPAAIFAFCCLFTWFLPPLLLPEAFTIDFANECVSKHKTVLGRIWRTELWSDFANLEKMAVHWTATESGPQLEFVAHPKEGRRRRLAATFSPCSEEAEVVRKLLQTFKDDSEVFVEGMGNLGKKQAP